MAVKNMRDIEALESMPLERRQMPGSTYAALQRCAGVYSHEPALSFFLDAKRYGQTHDWNYHELLADITRAANAFHALGIGPDDVLAFLLPNLPETHFTIWGGEAAGIVMAILGKPVVPPVQK